LEYTPLEDALEKWLATGTNRFIPLFPAPLEALFTAETAGTKIRALRISTGAGILAGIALVPAFWMMMRDGHAAIRATWVGAAIPAALACHLLLWIRLPVRWQELQTAAFGVALAWCFSVVMCRTSADISTSYFAGMVLLMMLDVIGGGFRFRLGAAFATVLTIMFAITIRAMPAGAGLSGLVDSGLMAVCCLFAVFGAWRVETETRRSWALMLRERLQRRALADHNTELVELSRRDPLTGLANRRAYEVAELASWRTAEAMGVPLGLVVLDIDHFKRYNDFYGHPAGDLCLQTVARCLSEQLRGNGDMVARVGGEEFAILLPDLTVETVGDIAERVRRSVAELQVPHLGIDHERIVTVSCGACSLVPRPGASPKDLFAAADAALYSAKQAGRNRVCLAEQMYADQDPEPVGSGLPMKQA
jgi:diguanylate cyclase (GGDEF)-like protein